MTVRGRILWHPSDEVIASNRIAEFTKWLAVERDLTFADYNALWEWSISDLEGFWSAIWEFCGVRHFAPYEVILARDTMPGAQWCPGAQVNYADQILHHAQARGDELALIIRSETFGRRTFTWAQLLQQVASVATQLREMGVTQGDRVVAILPNTETALIAFLATASLGAIWSICAPDMGHVAILDRFQQIEPKVLITQDGYVHGGKTIDRRDVLAQITGGLPTVKHVVSLSIFDDVPAGHTPWSEMTHRKAAFSPVPVPFDHPLWIVYSSGTTGSPKPIVHGHGGIILEASKQSLHHNLRASDRFCWLTSSGWIMWNAQWMALGQGATVALFDGAPNHPDMDVVWRFVADEKLTQFGAGAAFYDGCRKAGVVATQYDLSALKVLGSTGSPLSSDAYDWVYRDVKMDVWLAPISGGTDLAGGFVLGHPGMPVRAGEMQCRALGNAVHAFDETGCAVYGEVGELVCTRPLPAMPLFFWGDQDGTRLYKSYYNTYDGVWRHGDWITIFEDGMSVVYGRSDATINRKGLRLGSSEIYRAVEALDEVLDSLVVDLEFLSRESYMPLFVVLRDGVVLNGALKDKINNAIRSNISARFMPNEIVQISEIPRTLSGKKLEVPIKKLLLGGDPDAVVNKDSMANPASFDFFIQYAARRTAS